LRLVHRPVLESNHEFNEAPVISNALSMSFRAKREILASGKRFLSRIPSHSFGGRSFEMTNVDLWRLSGMFRKRPRAGRGAPYSNRNLENRYRSNSQPFQQWDANSRRLCRNGDCIREFGETRESNTEHIRPGPPAACYHAELGKVLVKDFGQGMVKIDRLSKFIAKLPRLARNDASATLLSLRGAEGDEATSAHHDRARRTLSDSRFMLRTAL